jgi:hypothetical protein
MNTLKDLKALSEEYQKIKAPEELERMAEKMLKDTKNNDTIYVISNDNMPKKKMGLKRGIAVTAASLVFIFMITLNVNYSFAMSMEKMPVVGYIAKFLTFREYENISDTHSVQIDKMQINDMENTEFENVLNEKYEKHAAELYKEFMSELDLGSDNIGLLSNYKIKADTGITISIENSTFKSSASGSETLTYDTIDMPHELYITLPSLFKDTSYVDVISEIISKQIEQQTAEDDGKVYYTDNDKFEKISDTQTFYINNDNKLVIVFDEYAIAPGYMGPAEFVIPTDEINNILVSDVYIK